MTATAQTVHLTTAQALVRFLNAQYLQVDGVQTPFVEGIFTIFGHGNVLGLGEALTQAPGHLQVYQGHNEQGMASAAIAYSRQLQRRKIFAVTASAGPGSANFLTAAGNAYVNSIPVLFLPADTFASRQPDPVLQQIEIAQSAATTTNDALRPLSKYWDRVERPEQLMRALLNAFDVLTDPAQAGPVTIALPQDTEAEAYDYPVSFFAKRVHVIKRLLPSAEELDAAVNAIQHARQPVMIVGGGAAYSDAGDEIAAFAHALNLAILETPSGKSTVPDAVAENLGGVGVLGTGAANAALAKADLVIGLGTRYTDFTTASKTALDPNQVAMININLNRTQALRFNALGIQADVKATLPLLLARLQDYHAATSPTPLKQAWLKERARLAAINPSAATFTPEIAAHFDKATLTAYQTALRTHLAQTTALMMINRLIPSDAIIVAAAGSLPGDLHRLWCTQVAHTYHMEYGYSMMGYEIAGALGAKLAAPTQEVYALVGDGSFMMLHSELVTALQLDRKINILVFDNAGFASINNLQMSQGNPSFLTEFRNADASIHTTDFAQIARGYGAVAYTATTQAELETALAEAQQQTRSTLIDIKVLPKTMTHGYGQSWWHVGVPAHSENPDVQAAYAAMQAALDAAFKY
ncbi:3D-(3,5/4)-trihydroxycyclohexane-1,2-dione acylhydrolase (decyclizing) [Lacticaseibacillus sp. GG6-2]